MTRTHEGGDDARDLRIAVVVSRFNQGISDRLLEGALECLRSGAIDESNLSDPASRVSRHVIEVGSSSPDNGPQAHDRIDLAR